jgi:hypothetical protein
MQQATTREACRSASGLAAALTPFAAIADRSLPRDRRDAMIAAGCLIVPWTIHPEGKDVGGSLCADGTPVEASLAFDRTGTIELRLVGDVGAGIVAHTAPERRRQVIERCARFAGPGAVGAMIGELAARHIEGLPPTARALAFVGAGASASRPFHRMFYFSFSGMAPGAAQALLARHVDATIGDRLWSLAGRLGFPVQGVGYDVEDDRIAKLQIYCRFPVEAGQDVRMRLSRLNHGDVDRCADLLSTILPPTITHSNHHLLGLGVATEHIAGQRIAPRLYSPLVAHGVDSFAGLRPAFAALASRWGADLPEAIGMTSAYTPTLLSVSSVAASERCALYFKIDGRAQPV